MMRLRRFAARYIFAIEQGRHYSAHLFSLLDL